MWTILSVSVLLTTHSSFVWTAYPFTFSERECRDLFPERIGKDSLSDHVNHDLPFEIEPSDSIYGISPNGIHGAYFLLGKILIKNDIDRKKSVKIEELFYLKNCYCYFFNSLKYFTQF